jgi:hypothetical protein
MKHNKHNIPILSYLWRNKSLLLCFAAAYLLTRWESVFQAAGPMVYLPVMFFGAVLAANLVRHFFWRKTVDEYARIGGFTNDWFNELTKAERAKWTVIITLSLIASASIIAAAIAK